MSTVEHQNGHSLQEDEEPSSSQHDDNVKEPEPVMSAEDSPKIPTPPPLTSPGQGTVPQQTWITNTATTLESNGVVMRRFSGSEPRGPPQLVRKPIFPDERVNCAYCGTTGDVDKYYAKSNRKEFCSINCLKAATKKMYEIPAGSTAKRKELAPDRKLSIQNDHDDMPHLFKPFKRSLDFRKLSPSLTVEVNKTHSVTSDSSDRLKLNLPKAEPKISPGVQNTYDWTLDLESDPDFSAAPVSSFRHVPVRGIWENVQPGMKLEVENRDANHAAVAFWVASVIRIHGYKVLLRFEGYGTDSSRDFWENLCMPEVHPVGWCATQNKPLIPPSALNARNKDWREFLVKRLTGARTIPQNFHEKVNTSLKSKYEIGTQLEIVDKSRISRVRLATIVSGIGKRLRLIYYDENDVEDDFWCHENSSLIHPLGWANAVGQDIYAPKDYNPPNIHSKMKAKYSSLQIEAGMKLEAVDPLNLSVICAATIKKVLRYDYIMVRVDCYEEDTDGSDWFCYDLTSPSIFPCGFCASNGIPLTPPNGYAKETFNWNSYLRETKSKPAPLNFTQQKTVAHGFKDGMRLEAADLMDPRLICVATISNVVGNLMKIHFNGWEEEYDQWLDAGSPDIYPIGWCELVRHRLEAPPQPQVAKKQQKVVKKKSKKAPPPTKRVASTPVTDPPKEKKRKLLTRTATGPQKLTPSYMKTRIPPAVTKKTLLGSNNSEPKRKSSNDSSDSLQSSETTYPNRSRLLPSVSEGHDHNGNGNGEGTSKEYPDTPLEKIIPKLIDSPPPNLADVDPLIWDAADVSEFLRINDCGAYCDSFDRNRIDGTKLLSLTKDQIIVLTGIKVGPAVKILDMISQLKRSANVARVRKNIFP